MMICYNNLMQIFIELSLIVALTTAIALIMRVFRQPLVVGYIVSGILVGPYVLDVLHSTESMELFSKIGISILLFIVGLNLNPETIKETGRASLIVGIGQVLFTAIGGFYIMQFLGFETVHSIYGAIALSFSSTIIVLKVLSDKGDLGKLYSKMSIGVLLVQDIVATVALLAVSVLGEGSGGSIGIGPTVFALLVKGAIAFMVLYLLGKYVLPKLSEYMAHTPELLFLFSLAWGLGLSSLFYYLGFSIEIGALVAGVTLSVSTFAFEIASRMKPLRDFFIVLFFVLLGSQMVFTDLNELIIPAILLSAFVLLVKPIIVIVFMNLVGYRNRTGFMTGVSLGQISEFSLILVALGLAVGQISEQVSSLVALVAIITITLSTYLSIHTDKLHRLLRPILPLLELRKITHREPKTFCDASDILIFGYDRVGFDFVSVAEELESKYLVIDFNPKSIKKLQDTNIPFRFGDAEDVEFLQEICLSEAKIVVSTIPDFKTNLLLLRTYRKENTSGIIILISHDMKEAKELYLHGATYVTMPHYLGAHHASKMIAEHGFNIEGFEKERNKHLNHLAKREKVIGATAATSAATTNG